MPRDNCTVPGAQYILQGQLICGVFIYYLRQASGFLKIYILFSTLFCSLSLAGDVTLRFFGQEPISTHDTYYSAVVFIDV